MKRGKNSPFYLAIATEKASLEVMLHSPRPIVQVENHFITFFITLKANLHCIVMDIWNNTNIKDIKTITIVMIKLS